MKSQLYLLACIFSLIMGACTNKATTETTAIIESDQRRNKDTLEYEITKISKFLMCAEDTCAVAKVDHIQLSDTAPKSSAINSILTKNIRAEYATISIALDSFMMPAKVHYEEYPDLGGHYNYEMNQRVIVNNSTRFIVQEFFYSFTGGAHGVYGTSFHNLDRLTGKEVQLADLFRPGFEAPLRQIAEVAFKKEYLEEGQTSLVDAGFSFEKEQFHLPSTFGITETGLTFIYNIYEIAPYAMGPQSIEIPFSDLKEWLKK